MLRHVLRGLAFLSVSGLVACSGGADDASGSDEGDYRSKPKGPDNGPGTLVVVAPPVEPGTTLGGMTVRLSTLSGEGAMGVPFTGIRAGQVTLTLGSKDNAEGAYSMSATTAIAANEARKVELGGLVVTAGPGPETLELSRGATAFITSTVVNLATNGHSFTAMATATGQKTTPVLPGEYVLAYGPADGVVAKTEAGKTVKVDLRDYAQRKVARIVPAAKDLPDACPTNRGVATLLFKSPRTSYDGTSFTIGGPIEVGVNDRVLTVKNGGIQPDFRLQLPCVSLSPRVELGALGAGPKDMKLGRLDVDDVEVTMGDGSKKLVRGTYKVFDATGTSMILSQQMPTNTGIDLPPGTYKLRVEYPQSAGTTGSFEETFTTP